MVVRMEMLKKWLPPELIRIGRHITGYGSCYRGEFSTWEEADALAEGYDAGNILDKVLKATIAVRDGKAAFERDSVLFYKHDDRFQLLAAIMLSAAENSGNLRMLDFGGSLGSAYFQCRYWLKNLPYVKWCVVEQENFVKVGSEKIADGNLVFISSIEEASKIEKFDIVVFSSVLQYLKDFSDIIGQVVATQPKYIFIDRTPMIDGDKDIICLQKQGGFTNIVRSSYPLRLLTRKSIFAAIGKEYNLLSEFDALDEPMGGFGKRVDYKGFLFERIGG